MKEGNTKTMEVQDTPTNASKYFQQVTCFFFYFENRTLESEVT